MPYVKILRSMNSRTSPHRAANEALLDQRYRLFKQGILDRLDDNPEMYLDASMNINVIAGRIQHSHVTHEHDGVGFTERFKVKGHIPIPQ